MHHWQDSFDWRAQAQRLNRLPRFVLDIDGAHVHFVQQKGTGPEPIPLVLTHGWPGSFIEMERIVPLLADPGLTGATRRTPSTWWSPRCPDSASPRPCPALPQARG